MVDRNFTTAFRECGTFVMSCLVTLCVLGTCIFMLGYEIGDRSIWLTMLSTVLGIWLPQPKLKNGSSSPSPPPSPEPVGRSRSNSAAAVEEEPKPSGSHSTGL